MIVHEKLASVKVRRHIATPPLFLGDVTPPLPRSTTSRERRTSHLKNRLDKFWSNQDKIYGYKSDITGIENRSLTSTILLH